MNRGIESYLRRKISLINLYSVTEIEEKLESYDLYSLVFLLYDVPATALSNLRGLSRVRSRRHSLTLLSDWAQEAQSATKRTSWRYELLEALTLCQLNNIIKKLGFDVEIVKKYFQPDNTHYSINIILTKKALYKLCENITDDKLDKLRASLKTYGLIVDDHKNFEMVILEMICNKLISIGGESSSTKMTNKSNVDIMVKIIEINGMPRLAEDLRDTEIKYNNGRYINEIVIENQVSETTTKKVIDKNTDDIILNSERIVINVSERNHNKLPKVTANDIFAIIKDTTDFMLQHLKADAIVM